MSITSLEKNALLDELDTKLREWGGRNLVASGEACDVLLDVRSVVAKIPADDYPDQPDGDLLTVEASLT